MFAMLKGKVKDKYDTKLVIDVAGVGYEVNVANVLAFENDQEVLLHIKTIVREDDISLYGFNKKEEKKIFTLLKSVNGVGSKTALSVLSYYSIDDIINIISSQNTKLLSKVPGIGAKTAERMILELKEKFKTSSFSSEKNSSYNDLFNALISLGFNATKAELALKQKIEDINKGRPLEDILREALQALA
jgi:holliday junction DNA helicase RuvA